MYGAGWCLRLGPLFYAGAVFCKSGNTIVLGAGLFDSGSRVFRGFARSVLWVSGKYISERKAMISYSDSTKNLTPDRLEGFFVGWPNPPKPETHLRVLRGSDHLVLAVDDTSGDVVGFITAITDGVLSPYVPLLEVLSPYRKAGIGGELVGRMLHKLNGLYMVDVTCHPDLKSFYSRFGMREATSVVIRDYDRQPGL